MNLLAVLDELLDSRLATSSRASLSHGGLPVRDGGIGLVVEAKLECH